ncbi:hypothetical protein ACTBAE_004199 [Klebsiella variicola]|uniref:hypothetical protein n=1 Tax=Pluralibacter gergoviae TaxID=61647 RepID=UPI00190D29F7|nr:hypothetical protein [Pluralibacter gergoviae]EGL0867602.1 hypothetical protein [Escherichia coli]EKS1978678.1 hypothetical protein [Klebsiella variicola]HBS7606540.1 hypothetical protein [Klebsiella pneumoniae]ELW9493432.1 hypothetical protein [Klebsiella variicola]MBK4117868.1 hypothetical protein [Pluralibacter gergoviae]
MIALTALDYLKYMGVGLVLIPFFLISKTVMIKTRNEFKNSGFGSAVFFLAVHIMLFLAPVGILLATYIDKGTSALLIASLTFLLILAGAYVYDRIIKRTFVIRIDEETFYALYHRAKDDGVSIKDLIVGRVKKE